MPAVNPDIYTSKNPISAIATYGAERAYFLTDGFFGSNPLAHDATTLTNALNSTFGGAAAKAAFTGLVCYDWEANLAVAGDPSNGNYTTAYGAMVAALQQMKSEMPLAMIGSYSIPSFKIFTTGGTSNIGVWNDCVPGPTPTDISTTAYAAHSLHWINGPSSLSVTDHLDVLCPVPYNTYEEGTFGLTVTQVDCLYRLQVETALYMSSLLSGKQVIPFMQDRWSPEGFRPYSFQMHSAANLDRFFRLVLDAEYAGLSVDGIFLWDAEQFFSNLAFGGTNPYATAMAVDCPSGTTAADFELCMRQNSDVSLQTLRTLIDNDYTSAVSSYQLDQVTFSIG